MQVRFLLPAQRELAEAKQYYDREHAGLGERFKSAAHAAAIRIATQPFAWRIERGEVRRCLLNKFPYKLLYVVRGEAVIVLAVAHAHRKPGYWLERMNLL